MSEERFIDRLEAFMKAEGLNANKVTVAAELSNGLLGKALKTRGSMNSDSVERILCAYTNLSAEWLMTGKGTMYVNDLPGDMIVWFSFCVIGIKNLNVKTGDYLSKTHH